MSLGQAWDHGPVIAFIGVCFRPASMRGKPSHHVLAVTLLLLAVLLFDKVPPLLPVPRMSTRATA